MEKSSSMQRGISPFVDIFEVDPDPSSFVIEKIGHQKTVVYLWGKKKSSNNACTMAAAIFSQ